MSALLKSFLTALFVLPAFFAFAQPQQMPPMNGPAGPMRIVPPGVKLDTITRRDADNWEFVQICMPGKPSKMIYNEYSLHNSQLEGASIEYWESGIPHTICNYFKGQRTGLFLELDPMGTLMRTENYKSNLLEGPSRTYMPRSGLVTEETYYSQGRKHGKHTKWYPESRTLQEQGNYVDGVLEGPATWFYDNGTPSVQYTYHNGKLNGSAVVYFNNGKSSEMGSYENDEQSGHWKEFYENGNLKAEGDYIHGEKEGVWKQYDEGGKSLEPIKYKKGEPVKK